MRTKDKFDEPIFAGGGEGLYTGGLIFWHISRCTSYGICSKVTIKAPEYVKLTIKLTIKTPLTSFWSRIIKFEHIPLMLQCSFCWLSSVNCRLGLLLVVLTFCACWNQFRKSSHLRRNYIPGQNIWSKIEKSTKTGQKKKIWYLLLGAYWLLLPNFNFRKGDWTLGYVST